MTRWQKLKSSVGMTERKAKSERRRAKGEERKAKSEQRAFLLLNRLDCLGMDLLVLDSRSVPASAERLDQVNRRNHLLAEELRRQPLVGRVFSAGLRDLGCPSLLTSVFRPVG